MNTIFAAPVKHAAELNMQGFAAPVKHAAELNMQGWVSLNQEGYIPL